METKKIKVVNPHGLHLREAARIITVAKKYNSRVQIWHNKAKAETDSILDVLRLAVAQNAEVTLVVEGEDEKEAVKEISQTFQDGGGI